MQLTCSVNRSDEFRGTNMECWEERSAIYKSEGFYDKIETRYVFMISKKKPFPPKFKSIKTLVRKETPEARKIT